MSPIDQLNITQFLFQLVLLVVSLSTPIIVTAIVKYLQARVGNENLKKYIEYAKTAVQAAESIYTESVKVSLRNPMLKYIYLKRLARLYLQKILIN